MLDIKFIRENPEKVKEACRARQVECNVELILELSNELRRYEMIQEQINTIKNIGSRRIGTIQDPRKKEQVISDTTAEVRNYLIEKGVVSEGREIQTRIQELEESIKKLQYEIPNIPLEGVPLGGEENNQILRQWGDKPKFDFEAKDHLELGEVLDIIDVKRAAKVAGSRFGYLKGDAVLLEFALVELAMKMAIKEGFMPIVPPVFVKSEMMQKMGYVDTPEDLAERYFFEKEGLFLVGTSEQAVGPMHAGEVFEERDLPRRYVAFSTCFREEAGSYGKDTRGILRVHQFDKVELFSFCLPEKSREEHNFLVAVEERLWQQLEIPYRVVQLAAGDMSRPVASTIDIEAWMSSQNRYREVSSASNTTDFQARRLSIRYRTRDGKLNFVHMLNATGLAIGRTIITILENYQEKNGNVKIPNVLQKYMGKDTIKRVG